MGDVERLRRCRFADAPSNRISRMAAALSASERERERIGFQSRDRRPDRVGIAVGRPSHEEAEGAWIDRRQAAVMSQGRRREPVPDGSTAGHLPDRHEDEETTAEKEAENRCHGGTGSEMNRCHDGLLPGATVAPLSEDRKGRFVG